MVIVIPLLSAIGGLKAAEATLKYFISQTVASVLFLFFFLVSCMRALGAVNFIPVLILFKLGLPPFQSWLVRICLARPYKTLLIILFIQKFIPLHILGSLPSSQQLLSLVLFFSSTYCLFCLNNVRRVRVVLLISAWGNTA